jgi:hypothetical protein
MMANSTMLLGVAGLSMIAGAASASINVGYSGTITFSDSPMVNVGESFSIETMFDPALPDTNDDPNIANALDPWMWHWNTWDWLGRFEIDLNVPQERLVFTGVFEDDSMGNSPLGTLFVSTFNFAPGTILDDSFAGVPFATSALSADLASTFQVFDPTGRLLIEGVITTVTPAPGTAMLGIGAAGLLVGRRRR